MLALIKLQNGTEVIGKIEDSKDDQTLILKDPMQINYRLSATQPMPIVSVSRYMPFSEQCVIKFDRNNIMHVAEPRDAMSKYYYHAIDTYYEYVDKSIDKELLNAISYKDKNLEKAYKDLLDHFHFEGSSH